MNMFEADDAIDDDDDGNDYVMMMLKDVMVKMIVDVQ